MHKYITSIENFWQIRQEINSDKNLLRDVKLLTQEILENLNSGKIRVCEKINDQWLTNEWIKKALLLFFQFNESQIYNNNIIKWYDKISLKFNNNVLDDQIKAMNTRIVPGAFVRSGAYIAPKCVIMPSFINVGAYIGEGSMIDSWVTIGSCAQIGKNCHISGGVGIGGVLEPLQSRPVIIEDNCFIGARSEIAEGVIIEEGAVLGMGVFIGGSTKIIYRDTGEIIYGRVPRNCVVVPGSLPDIDPKKPSLYCAVIIKQADASTRSKTTINELLRS